MSFNFLYCLSLSLYIQGILICVSNFTGKFLIPKQENKIQINIGPITLHFPDTGFLTGNNGEINKQDKSERRRETLNLLAEVDFYQCGAGA